MFTNYQMNTGTLFSFSLYLIGMLSIGIYFYYQTNELSDYILGGRGLNSWVAAMSASASDMSGWLLLGLPGYAYLSGLESIWIALGLGLGTYLNWLFIAKPLRIYSEKANNSITLSEYLSNRFEDDTSILKILSALIILIFFLIYTASGFVAGAKLFNTVFNIPYQQSLVIGVLVIISYTFLGGFMAVSWTDFFQGIIMFLAICLVPYFTIKNLGGFQKALEQYQTLGRNLLNPLISSNNSFIGIIPMASLMAWGLGYFGQPHILVRFMAISSKDKVKKARSIALTWSVISLSCAILVGIVGAIYLSTPLTGNSSETVFIKLIQSLFNPIVAGFLLAAILAAIMSTADSQLLVTSSALTEDLYRVLLKTNATEKHYMKIGRISVIIMAMIAYLIARNPNSNILTLVGYAWAGFGAAFGPVIILSLYYRNMTKLSAIAGIIVGGLTVIIWKNLSGGIFEMYELLPGFILSFCVIILVSLITTRPSQRVLDTFDSVKKMRHKKRSIS